VPGSKPTFSHCFHAVFKWTMCHYREMVCLPEAWRETDAVPSGDDWGGWQMGDALNAAGVERPPRGLL
jgi:hypothetical protein